MSATTLEIYIPIAAAYVIKFQWARCRLSYLACKYYMYCLYVILDGWGRWGQWYQWRERWECSTPEHTGYTRSVHDTLISKFHPYNREIFFYKQFKIIVNVLVSSFCFIWIAMFRVYDYFKFFSFFSTGIDFRCQNRTSIDEAVWPDHFSVKMALRALISSEFSRGSITARPLLLCFRRACGPRAVRVKNPWSHSKRIQDNHDFLLPSVAMLPLLCVKRHKAIFTNFLMFTSAVTQTSLAAD